MRKILTAVPPTPPMNEIDVRTALEHVQAQRKAAYGAEEIRRLAAMERRLAKKLEKVHRRNTRANDGHHPSEKQR